MGKRLFWLLIICALLLAAGWYLYSRLARPVPPDNPVASHWPTVASPDSPNPANRSANRASTTPSAGEVAAKKEPTASAPGFTLRQGETLEYDANLTQLNSPVAHLKISAVEKRVTQGKGTWHLQALAHTENPYRMIFELDDQFDSYSDAASMTSVQYEMHLIERGQKQDTVQRLLPSMQDPAPPGQSAVRVLPGTRDPLGLLQYLRGVDWNSTPQVRSPVFDGRKLYEVRAVLVGKSVAALVPAGKFRTLKIEIHVLDNGTEMQNAHFFLYLVNDSTRLPVLLEAVLPFATARVELTRWK